MSAAILREHFRRSDTWACSILTGSLSVYSASHFPWYCTLLLLFTHGTFFAFTINAVHELGHQTVFKTKRLNEIFVHVFAFIGWNNHRMFEASHVRHHRSTLHPPEDLEVVLPIKITLEDFLKNAFVRPQSVIPTIKKHVNVARGRFIGEWENKLFPEDRPEKRVAPVRWSRTILAGHAAILVIALVTRQWMLPVVISLAPFYGQWLLFLCNATQHVGLQDNTSDFRLNSRTFLLNPFVRFLYWQMNYHIEHHMYVGVPCYHLGRLHRLIEDDLPPSPNGLIAVWLEISAILKKQKLDAAYVEPRRVPNRALTLSEQSEGLSRERNLKEIMCV